MTLDEAIKHAEDTANTRSDLCEECREEHRQLAEWLKELEQYRMTGYTPDTIKQLVKERDMVFKSSSNAVADLCAEINALRRERDAAVEDLKIADKNCRFCKWYDKNYAKGRYCSNDDGCGYGEDSHWEWRGLQETTL